MVTLMGEHKVRPYVFGSKTNKIGFVLSYLTSLFFVVSLLMNRGVLLWVLEGNCRDSVGKLTTIELSHSKLWATQPSLKLELVSFYLILLEQVKVTIYRVD